MKLTASNVRTLPVEAGKSETIYFDDEIPGFGVRVREGGSRTFIFQYKLGEKQRRMSLGSVSAIPIERARKGYRDKHGVQIQGAEQLHARVKLAQDPATDKAEARAAAVQTFKAATTDFLAHKRTTLRERTYSDLERNLLKYSRPLHELQMAKITRRDIAPVLTSVTNSSGKVSANRVRTSLSTLFSWALEQGRADTNPVIGTTRHKERERARVLTPAELRSIWSHAGNDDFGSIVRLLALTGQRAG
jgi:hypothetical protein